MANQKLTALTENTDPLGSDLEYMVDDPAGTPASRKIYKGSNNLLPDGFLMNGDFSVTVSSNNLTIALKTKSGGNPSATDPVSIWLGGSYRRCTATLSKTFNAGTNWAGLGGTQFATLEQDLFLYAIWNTTPGTDIFDIGWSRIAHGRVYSDFSGTSTAENYLGYANGSAPTSTDNCMVIGRFAATLSATASFNWSVPTYTNSNFIRHPIDFTRELSYTPTLVGFSVNPTTLIARYRLHNNTVFVTFFCNAGTSNATNFTVSAPFTSKTISSFFWDSALGALTDNTAAAATGDVFIGSASATFTLRKASQGTWTSSGTKSATFPMRYEI